jgi:hypothetical protein
MAEYPFMFLPYLDQRKDTLRIEGFYLSLAGTYLRQWNEGAETYWERKIDEDFSQARYWVDVNQDGRREIVISFAHFWDRNGYKVRRTWKVLDGKTGRLVWEYVHHNSTNNRIKFCDLNKDGIPDFIFDNNNLIEVVDGQKGTILLTNYWGLKGTLYVIDTNETSLPTIYCLGNVLTSYETKEAQIYTRHTHNHTTSAPFVTAGEGTALVANANHYGPPYINPFYYLFKLPKNYLPNPKTNRMELESPLKINLPGYYRSSFFMHDNGQVLIGIVTSMGVIGLYNQEAQLVGLYQGPKGMISLKLQEENGTQEIIIKTNKNEIYHYNKKIDIELWQGISY